MLNGCTPLPPHAIGRYYNHGFYQGAALPQLLSDAARAYATCTALIHGEHRLTYRELNRRVERMAAGLTLRGIRCGDRVILQLPNVPEFVITAYALMRAGALPVFAPISHRAREIAHLAHITEAAAYIGPGLHHGFDHAKMAAEISDDHPRLRRAFTLDGPEGTQTGFATAPSGCLFFPLGSVDAPSDRDRTYHPNDVAFFLPSSRTAGSPKLIPRTHNDFAYQTRAAADLINLGPQDVYLAALPAESNLTLGAPGILGALAAGATVVLIDTPDPADAFPTIEAEKVTVTSLLPAVAQLWLDTPLNGQYDLSSLRLIQIGSAPVPSELAARIQPAFDCRLQQVYGTAEGLLCLTRLTDTDDVIHHTQGRPLSPGDEIRITNAHGTDQPTGTPGQLWMRGPYTLRGYYKAPDHNTHAFTPDGFFKTGHTARLTEDGNLLIEAHTDAADSSLPEPANPPTEPPHQPARPRLDP
ncbi:(2,3-dihydroxybenzoyl)adenylate synthase [Streptomyces piniterrae]|uniref:(2,3-dihydroxybenzoyl)adenylate synthase n=1 Tax=Streptomyces piniterrae TaxID=2571125 RepID=A0A4U0NS61_9ACTN|nr:AMP-binding protein [Streptomyces piniterrae]TJZ57439.1 (2,3-dihydroxybenzoyl)adenylate synthase [Streptomyces piniterrae]